MQQTDEEKAAFQTAQEAADALSHFPPKEVLKALVRIGRERKDAQLEHAALEALRKLRPGLSVYGLEMLF